MAVDLDLSLSDDDDDEVLPMTCNSRESRSNVRLQTVSFSAITDKKLAGHPKNLAIILHIDRISATRLC